MSKEKTREIICGIATVRNKVNGKVYVVSGKNVNNTLYGVFWQMDNGVQLNHALKKDYLLHGYDAFEFFVEEECPPHKLKSRRAHWIKKLDAYNPEKGYNRSPQQCAEATREFWANLKSTPCYKKFQAERLKNVA